MKHKLVHLLVDMAENKSVGKKFEKNPNAVAKKYGLSRKEREAVASRSGAKIRKAIAKYKRAAGKGEKKMNITFCAVLKGGGGHP